jgi:CHAD domain-containing protein
MAVSGKWIDGISSESDVSDAAQRSLQARMAVVQHYLPLAALMADQDVEHVHRLRVATRRAAAALRLYRHFLPRRRRRLLKDMLNDIRRAAGTARDLDVLSMGLEAAYGDQLGQVRNELVSRRAHAQTSVREVYERAMKEGTLQQLTFETLMRIRPRRKRDKKVAQLRFADWARKQLSHTADQFFAAQPADGADYPALHRFRIVGKNLRYVMELLAGAFGDEFRKVAYPKVERLQERLGAINDHYTAASQLAQWEHSATSDDETELLARLAERERIELESSVAAFHAWWTAERAAELRQALMGEPPPGTSAPSSGNGSISREPRTTAI